MGSASSRDTHTTSCSIPAGGRNPTFCQGKRVGHRLPGCFPAFQPLCAWTALALLGHLPTSRGHGVDSCYKLVYTQALTQPEVPLPPQPLGYFTPED